MVAMMTTTARNGFGWKLMLGVSLLVVWGGVIGAEEGAWAEEGGGGAAQWPGWRGPRRDGVSRETGWESKWPAGGPGLLWEAAVGVGYSSMAVVGGQLYTMGNIDDVDVVWCLDAASGKEVWRHEYACKKGRYPGPRMTPTVDGQWVYTLGREGQLFCLSEGDGSVKWSVDITELGAKQTKYRWGFSCSPLVWGNLLILDVGKVLALEKKTGELKWESGNEEAACSSPVAFEVGGSTYVTSFDTYGLALVDVARGKESARYKWPDPHGGLKVATPIVAGDKVFISSCRAEGHNTTGLFQVAGGKLKPLVVNSNIETHVTSCVLWQGYLYGFDGMLGARGKLKCLDFETLEVKWAEGGLKVGSLMVADGKLLALAGDGTLICAKAGAAGYEEISRAKVLEGTCWTCPVLADGRVYCRNHAGRLVCLDVNARVQGRSAERPRMSPMY